MERVAAAKWSAPLDNGASYHAHQQARLAVARSSIPLTPCTPPTETKASPMNAFGNDACSNSNEAEVAASSAQTNKLMSTITLRSPHEGIPSRLGVGEMLC